MANTNQEKRSACQTRASANLCQAVAEFYDAKSNGGPRRLAVGSFANRAVGDIGRRCHCGVDQSPIADNVGQQCNSIIGSGATTPQDYPE
jgi:hypothetical protein